jgi:hypothetical protein
LPTWGYFPKDVETADLSSSGWWNSVINRIIDTALALGVNAVCSPAIVPSVYPDSYYVQLVEIGAILLERLRGTGVSPLLTTVVDMNDVAQKGRALTIASILTRSEIDRVFLILKNETEPRRELADAEQLKGAMKLIACLREAGVETLVGFCSSDMLLWKAAGASSCATGKFFNLRRFMLTRFAEPSEGGGQVPYWFEESLLAFLRQGDIFRIQQRDLFSESTNENPIVPRILEQIPSGKPWIGLSWRQYMWWFANAEGRFDAGAVTPRSLIELADQNWGRLETPPPKVFLDERNNDGLWLRQWLRALEELPFFE